MCKMGFKLCHNLLHNMKTTCTYQTPPSCAEVSESFAGIDINSQLICMVPWLSAIKNHFARNYPHLWHARLEQWVQNIPPLVSTQSYNNSVHPYHNYSFKMHFNPSIYGYDFKSSLFCLRLKSTFQNVYGNHMEIVKCRLLFRQTSQQYIF